MSTVPLVLWHQLLMGDIVLGVSLLLLCVAATCRMARQIGRSPFGSRTPGVAHLAANIGAILALEQVYEFARGLIPHNRDVAFLHSYAVLDFEWRHGFFVESRIENFFLHFSALMNVVDVFYAVGHAVGTIGVLVWLYVWRREHYATIRNIFMVTTGVALAVFYAYPTAPPRMFPNYGFADPEQMHHLVQAGGAQLSSYTYNPYAAMPSLHVGYALIVGLALFVAGRGKAAKVAAAIYPMAMVATVIISANHWILDVVGACVTVSFAWLVAHMARRVHVGALASHVRPFVPGRERPTVLPIAVPD